MHPGSLTFRALGMLAIGVACSLIACSGGGGGSSASAVATTTNSTATGSVTPTSSLPKALVEIIVAPDGKATNPGTIDAPTTLEAARDQLRNNPRTTAGILRVLLRGGIYVRSTTFALSSQDSGTANNPIEYIAYPGETPRIAGGALLDPASLKPVDASDSNFSRLAPEAASHIFVADLSAYGSSLGTLDSRLLDNGAVNQAAELFVDGTPMTLAQYPDAADPASVNLAGRNITLQVSGISNPDVTGTYTYMGNDGLGRPYYSLQKGGNTWSITSEPGWRISDRTDLGGKGSATWGNWEGLNGPVGRFPASGGSAQGELLVEPSDGSPAVPGFMLIRTTDGISTFEATTPSPRVWAKPQDAMIYGFYYYSWAAFHLKPQSVSTTGKVQLATPPPTYGIRSGQPVFAYNVLEELTTPGEYFIDRDLKRLYLRAPSDRVPGEVMLSRMQDPLVRLTSTNLVTFSGLTFEATKDSLVEAPSCTSVSFLACTFRNSGGMGLRLGGSQNLVDGCSVAGLGKAGIQVWGGDRYQLVNSGSRIQNCDIHHVGRLFWTYQPAIKIAAYGTASDPDACAGVIVANNTLHHLPHTALEFSGNEHQILRNDIHHACQWTNDAGAVYTGRDWGSQGNLIQNNLFRYNGGPMGLFVSSVYLDDCASGITVEANIFYRSAPLFALQHGGGRDVSLRYNIFVGHWVGVATDNRGTTAINNVPGDSFNLLEKIQKFNYQVPMWASRYPSLASIPADFAQVKDTHWLQPEGVVVVGNLQSGSTSAILNQPVNGPIVKWFSKVEQNLEGVDPGFVNPDGGNFALRTDSPMRAVAGFPGIDPTRIGPQH